MCICCFFYVFSSYFYCCLIFFYMYIFLFYVCIVIYVMDEEMDDFKGRSSYSFIFRTFDFIDYSLIGINVFRILEFKFCFL